MDANRTRFHLLLGPGDWGRVRIEVPASPPADDSVLADEAWNASPPRDVPLAYDYATSEIVLRSRVFRFVPATGETLSPLAGQVVVANLMPGRYGVVATPSAEYFARVGPRPSVSSSGCGKIARSFSASVIG